MKCIYIRFKNGLPCPLNRDDDREELNYLQSEIKFDEKNERIIPGHVVIDNTTDSASLISWANTIEEILEFEKEFWDYLIRDAQDTHCHQDYINQLMTYKDKILNQYSGYTLEINNIFYYHVKHGEELPIDQIEDELIINVLECEYNSGLKEGIIVEEVDPMSSKLLIWSDTEQKLRKKILSKRNYFHVFSQELKNEKDHHHKQFEELSKQLNPQGKIYYLSIIKSKVIYP